jgi:pectate lyase
MKKIIYLTLFAVFLGISQIFAQNAAFGYGSKATGGGSASPTLVDTYDELKNALSASDAKVIVITKSISFADKSRITCSKSNKTILAKKGVVLETTGFESKTSGVFLFKDCSNIILRNVKMEGPGADDNQCQDLLNLDGATNVWVDHCEFSDGVDGNFDIIGNSDNITVSWCRFFYEKTPKVEHQFSNLIASNATMKPSSDGRYSVTFAYNWWDHGCAQRMTRSRNSDLHFVSNYWNSNNASYYIGPGTTSLYIEGCYFDGNVEKKNIIKDAYEGSNSWTIVDSYAKKGLPSNNGSVKKPTYAYTVIPYQDVPSRITDASCGAGATLIVNDDGSVSSPCDENIPSIVLTSGVKDQSVTEGKAISSIVFAAGGSATNISVSGLPAGVTSSVNGLILTLSGTPTASGTYTVSATDGKTTTSLNGTITVKPASSGGNTEVGDQLCIDLTTGSKPSVDGVVIDIINDGADTKATTWNVQGVKFNTNKAGISFDLSSLGKTLVSVSFDVEIPNWAAEKNTVSYGFVAGSANESYSLANGSVTTVTVSAPAGATGFTICRTAGTGTFISNVCFGFANSSSGSGGNGGSGNEGDNVVSSSTMWNFSDEAFNTLSTVSSSQTINGLTITASETQNVMVDANEKSIDGISFTHRLKMSGTGAENARSLQFNVTGPCKIEMYVMSAKSTEERTVNIATGSFGNVVSSVPATTSLSKQTYEYNGGANTIYLYSASSGINFYAIKVIYPSSDVENVDLDKTLYYNGVAVINPENKRIVLYSVTGQILEQTNENIDMSRFGNGFYIVRSLDSVETLKIAK